MNNEPTPIEVTQTPPPTAPDIVQDGQKSGLIENIVITTPDGQPDEKIVFDRNVDGDIIGWHKQPVGVQF